jgi:hypothetical protein
VECKRGPELTISGSKFSNIVAILTVNILKNRNIASIFFKNRNKTSGFFSVEKYIKYSIYHVTDLANENHTICNIYIYYTSVYTFLKLF